MGFLRLKFISLIKMGGPLMWVLLFYSLLLLTVVLEKIYFFWFEFKKEWREGKIILEQEKERDFSEKKLVKKAELIFYPLFRKVESGMSVLGIIIKIAPLTGILGTILGIMNSFQSLKLGSAINGLEGVSAGISQALLTTAAGLIIAIVAVVFYSYFQRKQIVLTEEIELLINKLILEEEGKYVEKK